MGKSEHSFGNNDHWCTEPAIFAPLVRVWGGIGLDPCHSPHSRVPARTINWHPDHYQPGIAPRVPFTQWWIGDGLLIPWSGHGLVFGNYPFSDGRPWFEKATKEGDEVVLYGPARTGSGYWHEFAWAHASAIHFLKRGQVFEYNGEPARQPRGKQAGKPMPCPWHNALLYYGPHPQKLALAFPPSTGKTVFL